MTVQVVPDAARTQVDRASGEPTDLRERLMQAHADFGSLVAELELDDDRWTTVRPVVLAVAKRARAIAQMLCGGQGGPLRRSTERSGWGRAAAGSVVAPVLASRELASAGLKLDRALQSAGLSGEQIRELQSHLDQLRDGGRVVREAREAIG